MTIKPGKCTTRDGRKAFVRHVEVDAHHVPNLICDLAEELELQAAQDKAALCDAGFAESKRLRAANAKLREACEAALDDLNPNPAYDPNGIKAKLQAALAETAP